MDDLNLPHFKAAAVQAAPIFLNAEATVAKACDLIREVGRNGAQLVAFPEVFVPGYPYWNWTMTPIQGSAWYEKLYRNSIDVPGRHVDTLCKAARDAGCYVVIGVNERGSHSLGVLYNTILFIGPDGSLMGKHRKLVPTWAEKLTWTNGDGSTLNVYDTKIGKLGALACGENTNTLTRFALLAQGELVHVANYISLPVGPADYDMSEAIKVRSAAHAFEGKLFSLVSCSTISPEMIDMIAGRDDAVREMLQRKNSALSGIFGPDGRLIGDPLIDDEGIVYADIDLGRCIQPKQMHDIIGHYNRFDIFELRVNKTPNNPITIKGTGGAHEAPAPEQKSEETEAISVSHDH